MDLVLVFGKSGSHLEVLVDRWYFGDQEVVQDNCLQVDHHNVSSPNYLDQPLGFLTLLVLIYWSLEISYGALEHIDEIIERLSNTFNWFSDFRTKNTIKWDEELDIDEQVDCEGYCVLDALEDKEDKTSQLLKY